MLDLNVGHIYIITVSLCQYKLCYYFKGGGEEQYFVVILDDCYFLHFMARSF